MGATLGDTAREMYQGLVFGTPCGTPGREDLHFRSSVFQSLGFSVSPSPEDVRSDIIQTIVLNNRENLCAFCEAIQAHSPVNAHVTPVPSHLPGYQDEIIMAAGTFVQGASIELSSDAPLRDPFRVFMQGGLTFEHGRIASWLLPNRLWNKANKRNKKERSYWIYRIRWGRFCVQGRVG